ncbi:MAG: site-specific integrase [Bdellovibrionales bacterium]|nr:site-specific integrase [Bdellovibrionales bacterium]
MSQRNTDKYIKEANGIYEVRVTSEMKGQYFERRKRGILSKGEARLIANQLLDERDEFRKQIKSGQVSWLNAIAEWESYARYKKTSDTTIYSAKLTLEKHTADWNKRPVSSIINEEIEVLIHASLNEDQIETKKSLLKHIRNVFKRQVQLGKIKYNPSNGINLGPAPMKEKKAMTRNEITRLLIKAKEENHPWYSVWRITYELGLRAGEAYALRWEDVNLDSGFVSIKQSFNNKSKSFKAPKNNKFRAVPLNDSLREFMRELKSQSNEKEFVFERNTVWSHGEQAKVLAEFQKHIGIQQTNFHSLRASFITHLLLAGVPLLKVKEMVGHRRTETTETYMRMVAADTIGATSAIEIKD